MRITRDRKNHELRLSQTKYVEKVLSRFNMKNAMLVSTPLASHFKLSKKDSLKIEKEKDYMSRVSYAIVVDNLIYAMVSTRPDIAQVVRVASRFISKPRRMH